MHHVLQQIYHVDFVSTGPKHYEHYGGVAVPDGMSAHTTIASPRCLLGCVRLIHERSAW